MADVNTGGRALGGALGVPGPDCRAAALPALYEQVTHDGLLWLATGPGEALWFIRWHATDGTVAAYGSRSSSARFKGTAGDASEARRAAKRIAGLIAGGSTRED